MSKKRKQAVVQIISVTMNTRMGGFRAAVDDVRGHMMLLQSSCAGYHCTIALALHQKDATSVRIGAEHIIDSGPWKHVEVFRSTHAEDRVTMMADIAAFISEYPEEEWGIADARLTSDSTHHCLTVTVGAGRAAS